LVVIFFSKTAKLNKAYKANSPYRINIADKCAEELVVEKVKECSFRIEVVN